MLEGWKWKKKKKLAFAGLYSAVSSEVDLSSFCALPIKLLDTLTQTGNGWWKNNFRLLLGKLDFRTRESCDAFFFFFFFIFHFVTYRLYRHHNNYVPTYYIFLFFFYNFFFLRFDSSPFFLFFILPLSIRIIIRLFRSFFFLFFFSPLKILLIMMNLRFREDVHFSFETA